MRLRASSAEFLPLDIDNGTPRLGERVIGPDCWFFGNERGLSSPAGP
jgi:hypothetical protein